MKYKKIGLCAMAAKPFHSGHNSMIELASKQCEQVFIFTSEKDRENVSGKVMKKIWQFFINRTLPSNCKVQIVANPVQAVFDFLKEHAQDTDSKFLIFGGVEQLLNAFNGRKLHQWVPTLWRHHQIIKKPVKHDNPISGTEMRQDLKNGEKEKFIQGLAPNLQQHGEIIWSMLSR